MGLMISFYIHIPFCRRRCTYCDFITYAGMEKHLDDYVSALIQEIKFFDSSKREKLQIGTIYFGGGTPSLLSADNLGNIFEIIRKTFLISNHCEITVEVNPGTIGLDLLKSYQDMGVTRLSLGAQSFLNTDLIQLGRIHQVTDVYTTYSAARKVGIENINLDLIFGLPGQNLEAWERNLDKAIELDPEHLSLYSLTVEENTPLAAEILSGRLSVPDEDLSADMYEMAMEKLANANYRQYEISNWSRLGKYNSLHNRQYWLNEPYLGFGAGAHSCIEGYRIENKPGILDYIYSLDQPVVPFEFPFSPANLKWMKINHFTAMQETMMLGLRLTEEGVSEKRFFEKHNVPVLEVFRTEINDLLKVGLLEWVNDDTGRRLKLTTRGILLGNQVFMRFVGEGD